MGGLQECDANPSKVLDSVHAETDESSCPPLVDWQQAKLPTVTGGRGLQKSHTAQQRMGECAVQTQEKATPGQLGYGDEEKWGSPQPMSLQPEQGWAQMLPPQALNTTQPESVVSTTGSKEEAHLTQESGVSDGSVMYSPSSAHEPMATGPLPPQSSWLDPQAVGDAATDAEGTEGEGDTKEHTDTNQAAAGCQ